MKPSFSFGGIDVYGRHILAPMDGISDQPFRWLCRRMGSSIIYTEFINVLDVPKKLNDIDKRTCFTRTERPIGFQLYGNELSKILRAAQMLEEKKPDFIDLNLGCSVQRVSGRGAGAGLLKSPKLVSIILSKLTKHLHVPITVKIRLGWDTNSQNYLEIAHVAEDSGAAMIAVHARSRDQHWLEPSNWFAIGEIKGHVQIPVIGNGDIANHNDALRMLTETDCDAVMIGRAAIGNPWIFEKDLTKELLSKREILNVIRLHWNLTVAFYGTGRAVFLFKKHLKAYLSTPQFKRINLKQLLTTTNPMNSQLLTGHGLYSFK